MRLRRSFTARLKILEAHPTRLHFAWEFKYDNNNSNNKSFYIFHLSAVEQNIRRLPGLLSRPPARTSGRTDS